MITKINRHTGEITDINSVDELIKLLRESNQHQISIFTEQYLYQIQKKSMDKLNDIIEKFINEK